MTTPLVMSVTDELVAELEALAKDVQGWNLPRWFKEPEEGVLPEDWEWHVGQIGEEGGTYPVLLVNAHQYDSSDSEKLARYYAACNRDTILALLAERAELKRDAERLAFMLLKHRKVVIERLPRNQTEVYVEEGFMSDRKYPAASMTGDWVNDSPEALLLRKKAIDLAMNEPAA